MNDSSPTPSPYPLCGAMMIASVVSDDVTLEKLYEECRDVTLNRVLKSDVTSDGITVPFVQFIPQFFPAPCVRFSTTTSDTSISQDDVTPTKPLFPSILVAEIYMPIRIVRQTMESQLDTIANNRSSPPMPSITSYLGAPGVNTEQRANSRRG